MAMNACKVTKEATTKCILGWVLTKAFMDKAENISVLSYYKAYLLRFFFYISAVGVKVISFKAVLKSLPKIFAHADKGAQSEVMGRALALPLVKLLLRDVSGSTGELKQPQMKSKALKVLKNQTKLHQRKKKQKSLIHTTLLSRNWKEQKEEALDPLLAVLKPAIKIKAEYYDELQIVSYVLPSYMSVPVLEKFKKKKVNVVEALCNCLDAMAIMVKLSYLAEDIVTFSKHKSPQVKEQTIKFLVSCLCITENQMPKTEVKSFLDVMLGRLEDAVVPVREASAEGLGTLMKLVGKATFVPIIQG
ncbi:hypothetical protein PPACK8108_LOCUS2647 [Phakopsora pachyrhizi]|uniref:TOG domain-containing protein n=1 Tax=Phakopsora pachyrhizi TaxID=170000 RepID=A0AAV0AJY8_PHAPC|nr:hypothetical protein PPACK8108_LOCUS2647 [Phakopsora pachyrhizi]